MAYFVDASGRTQPFVSDEDYIRRKSVRNKKGCLRWTGKLSYNGYPLLPKVMAKRAGTHMVYRYLYELVVAPIPEGLTLDHLCKTRECVEPTHMEPVTMRENVLRGDTIVRENTKKTMCPQGHPYDTVNINGDRGCKRCKAEHTRRYRERRKAMSS